MAHSGAYTAPIRIPLLILRREIAVQLSQLPHHSHIEFVCQLKADPLEMKTELKATLKLKLVKLQRRTGKGLCFLSPISKQNSLSAILKFTSDVPLLHQKCQSQEAWHRGLHRVGARCVFLHRPSGLSCLHQGPKATACHRSPWGTQASRSDTVPPSGNRSSEDGAVRSQEYRAAGQQSWA